jgi:hypothetical protein
VIGNTPRQETNIQVEANKSFVFGIQFKKWNGDPLDLTGASVRLVAAQQPYLGGTEVLDLDAVHITDTQGLVQFQFQASDLALPAASYAYDVTLITVPGYSVPIIKGYLEVGVNTDPDTSNVFTDIHADSEITAVIGESNVVEITVERVDGMLTVTQGLIDDFRVEMTAEVVKAETAATDAEFWSKKTTTDINNLQTWMANMGYPYWKGTSQAYAALPAPDPTVMYLLVD